MRKISKILVPVGLVLLMILPVMTFSQQWGLYTLYATKNGTKAYLIDTADSPTTFHQWTFTSTKKSAYSAYLVPGDTLVRTYSYNGNVLTGGGISGGVQKVTWDGTVVWDFVYSSSTYCIHHDICPLPNGNVLMISYDVRTSSEATQAGSSTANSFYSEKLIEVKPTGATTGTIVWEWKLWDHMCQNYSSSKDNYVTSIVNNPQLMNINYTGTGNLPDRYHMNGIDYNEELDQIVLSIHFMNSAFVIDHSTTTAEAAGHTGGNSGKGGDFLYRWGNPASYGASGSTNFNVVHDAHWVSSDNPNYPNYLAAYNNNGGANNKTCIDIWNPPYDGNNYSLTAGQAYAPAAYDYRYTATFTANNEGNSHQLPNGNMLVNNFQGSIYEISPSGTTLWTKSGAMSSHAYRYSKCYVRGPVATASASAAIVCEGKPVNLSSSATSVTETNPTYTYSWTSSPAGFTSSSQNPVVNPLVPTTYTVTVTNTVIGCSDIATIPVSVYPETGIPVINGNGQMLSTTASTSYQWYMDGNPIADATGQSYTPEQSGNYQVEITDGNGCNAISENFAFTYTNLSRITDMDFPEIYPNPTNGKLTIENTSVNKVTVFNSMGAVIKFEENTNSLDLSEYPVGIYYVSISAENNVKLYKKIILIK